MCCVAARGSRSVVLNADRDDDAATSTDTDPVTTYITSRTLCRYLSVYLDFLTQRLSVL